MLEDLLPLCVTFLLATNAKIIITLFFFFLFDSHKKTLDLKTGALRLIFIFSKQLKKIRV
jgi:hypothetical protein